MLKTAKERRKSAGINLWESIFFILLILLGAYVLLGSSLFDIRRVSVEGNHTLAASEIITASGITVGANIFKVDLKQAAEKLKALPMIRDAQLVRRLPDQVLIRVAERRPAALVPWGDGFVQVDADGVCLQNGKPTGSLPVITGMSVRVPPPGQRVQGRGLDTALKVIGQLPAALVGQLSEVHLDSAGLVVLYTTDGVQCRLGTPDDIADKGAVLQQVLGDVRNQGRRIQYIDLSYVGMPVVKYAD